jgi:hypothetical protein
VLVKHEGSWHGIFWFRVGSDGSVYFGSRYKPTLELSIGRKLLPGKEWTVSDRDLTPVTEAFRLSDPHFSVHPSGAINMGGKRFHRDPLHPLRYQETICSVIFQHPKEYPVIEAARPGVLDLKLEYPVVENRPLLAELLIAPKGGEKYVTSDKVSFQMNLIVQFYGFPAGLDRSVQFALYHSAEGKWPKATYVILPGRTLPQSPDSPSQVPA